MHVDLLFCLSTTDFVWKKQPPGYLPYLTLRMIVCVCVFVCLLHIFTPFIFWFLASWMTQKSLGVEGSNKKKIWMSSWTLDYICPPQKKKWTNSSLKKGTISFQDVSIIIDSNHWLSGDMFSFKEIICGFLKVWRNMCVQRSEGCSWKKNWQKTFLSWHLVMDLACAMLEELPVSSLQVL